MKDPRARAHLTMTTDSGRKTVFSTTLRAMPGYPWLPCPICVREGFKGTASCDHIAAERARASGISFGIDTVH